jgi:hypothetical protein
MFHKGIIRWIASLIVLAVLAGGQWAVPQAAQQATAALTAAATAPADAITFGPGPFKLQPLTGLAGLNDYQATLNVDFKGNQDGKSNPWTATFELRVRGKPSARTLTSTFKGNAPAATHIAPWSAAMNGMFYWRTDDGACIGRAIEAQADPNSSPLVSELADFLPPAIGAEEAGAKKVNGIAAKGYKFDERALGAAGRAKATGEVWVADPGGYVLKYSVTLTGGPEYFGEGEDGTLTWAYDVTKVGQPATITLPKDCPEGLVDAPLMDDAQNVQRLSGITLYTTHATVVQISDFYQKQLPTAGWNLDGKPGIGDKAGFISFKQGKSRLSVVIVVSDAGTAVRLLLQSERKA